MDWLNTIHLDVRGLLINRYIFREVQQIIRSNSKIQLESSFYEWLGNIYATAAVIGVRSQLDAGTICISFAGLLIEMQATPEILSRERYVSLYKTSKLPNEVAHRHFDKLAGESRSHFPAETIEADFSSFRQKAESIRKYANKRIAHLDRSEFKELPTYAELDDCLDYLESLLKKYLRLFTADAYVHIVPAWQYDWQEIFRRRWIED